MKLKIKTMTSEKIYKGNTLTFLKDKIRINNKIDTVREYVTYPKAVGIIPLLDRDKIIMVRQYRYANKIYSLEIPAGKTSEKETLIRAAQRELAEETGYIGKKFQKIMEYYPAISYSTEKIHIFTAEKLKKGISRPDEDEFLEVEILSLLKILNLIRQNKILDSKTILAILFYARYIYS